jgi:hypothetical protein
MDRAMLEICVRGLAFVWEGRADIQDLVRVGNLLGKLGFTPSDRSRIVVPKDDGPKKPRGKL